jgi:hypothetical protein
MGVESREGMEGCDANRGSSALKLLRKASELKQFAFVAGLHSETGTIEFCLNS